MSTQKNRIRCKYCGLQFSLKEECIFHENNECELNPNLLKDKSPFTFIRFVIWSTLKVAAMGLAVLSPAVAYVFLLSIPRSSQYDYVALAIFWIIIFGIPSALAYAVDYIRKGQTK
ncbi:MAG: hypothetical protein QXD70_01190 [Candidatus Bathyarchaeia archaeon]